MSTPHVGASGFAIRITVTGLDEGEDISAATTLQIKLKPPTGSLRTVTAEFVTDGTDNQFEVVTVDDPEADLYLGEAGEWRVQGFLELPGWADHTDIGSFLVQANLV